MHPRGHGAGNEEHIGVPRGGDDPEAEVLKVDIRAGDQGELVLAAVAAAGVDVSDRKRATAIGSWQVDRATEAAEVSKKCQHQRSAQA